MDQALGIIVGWQLHTEMQKLTYEAQSQNRLQTGAATPCLLMDMVYINAFYPRTLTQMTIAISSYFLKLSLISGTA
jgi:hypothetical protein